MLTVSMRTSLVDGKRGETNTGSELRQLRKREENQPGIGLGPAGRQAPGGGGEETTRGLQAGGQARAKQSKTRDAMQNKIYYAYLGRQSQGKAKGYTQVQVSVIS